MNPENLHRVMFPDMEAEVIEAVLSANNGAVDPTVDHLLAMTRPDNSSRNPEDVEASIAEVRYTHPSKFTDSRTSLDHIKDKFGRIKNKKLPSLP